MSTPAPLTLAGALSPDALALAARTIRRVAEIVEEAGPLWRSAVRAGLVHVQRKWERAKTDPDACARAAAWSFAAETAHPCTGPVEAAAALRTLADGLAELGAHVEAGEIEARSVVGPDGTETLTATYSMDGRRGLMVYEATREEDGE